MLKSEFINSAPQYYSLAILAYLHDHLDAVSRQRLSNHYFDSDEQHSYLDRDRLFDLATAWLIREGIITIVTDPFGPPIISRSEHFRDLWEKLGENKDFPLFKDLMMPRSGDSWLRAALQNLDQEYQRLEIQDSDFDEPNKEWEPLPLEREDPQLQKVIEAVDNTAEKVRADNGYAAHLPEERQYVLDSLFTLSRRLKETSTVSLAYLREFAFAPLSKLLNRFRGAAIGLAAFGAKEALREWLKRKGTRGCGDHLHWPGRQLCRTH